MLHSYHSSISKLTSASNPSTKAETNFDSKGARKMLGKKSMAFENSVGWDRLNEVLERYRTSERDPDHLHEFDHKTSACSGVRTGAPVKDPSSDASIIGDAGG